MNPNSEAAVGHWPKDHTAMFGKFPKHVGYISMF